MTDYVFPPHPQASVAVRDSHARFPVRRIFCVGRNYAAHAREMGKDPDRDPPFFFTKPADAVVESGVPVPYPPGTANFHYEIELVVYIGKSGRNIAQDEVMDHLWGAGVGIDLTRRDLQLEARDKGRPWDFGKAFDRSAPLNPITPLARVPALDRGRIWLAVNDELRQDADLSELIWSVREHVSILSHSIALEAGDIIMTGTPAGVGAVEPGDVITGGIDGLGEIETEILDRIE
ncbi:fumarylacetoacetate hydrolase family protein [Mameliella alba]|nr:fumarylacetoacetate hydrolase family protein [Antarctobacter heliothermus]MBY6145838.1 fumarylacetoacetate hydrolase family protein [Mameliella alba]MBY6161160.1 fumarylacetoacetate hydrolase family protein [Mameliella alba]MBY6169630.1 fumarylacetoacetate hydrolase family protein [Mameliella alba]MBY6174649.1 fumarylacetoacetate hydrolase family protein [Mameliella alba]